MNEAQRNDQTMLNNQYFLNEGVMKLRIDSQRILRDIECFLRGGVYVTKKKDGQVVEEFEPRGTSKMNDRGVQSMMSLLTPWFSPMTVQGNFTIDRYEDYILELDLSVSKQLIINLPEWDVQEEDYNAIMDMIVLTAIPFFTRLIDDGERRSYASTVKVSEANTVQQSGGGLFGLVR